VLVAETVQNFITAMDAIKLEQRAVDELHPLISDLLNALNRVPGLPPDHISTTKLREWSVLRHTVPLVYSLSWSLSTACLYFTGWSP
jgi:ESCRT-I complex subunit VPS28